MDRRIVGLAASLFACLAPVLEPAALAQDAKTKDVQAKQAPAEPTPSKEKSKSIGEFGRATRGDVPDGTREVLGPEADRSIQNGLAWLAKSQNADGSFGSGT
jgi:hypothetical protein